MDLNEFNMNGYQLTDTWFSFAFENPDKVTPTHGIMYLWQVQLCNKMGWVEKFASPASQTMAACGIKSYNTYKKIFDDLVSWGLITLVSESKNQYTASIIALSNFDKALYNALDKAVTTHLTKQVESTCKSTIQSTDSIIKQQTTNKETLNYETNPLTPLEGESVLEKKEETLPLEEKKKKPPLPPPPQFPFDDFWNRYKHKEGDKKKARGLWEKLEPDIQKVIMEGIDAYVAVFSGQDKQYQPHPCTFLNQSRWETDSFKNPKPRNQSFTQNGTAAKKSPYPFAFDTSPAKDYGQLGNKKPILAADEQPF